MSTATKQKSLQEEIIEMTGESFDEGARSYHDSLVLALEVLYTKQPDLTFSEVITVIKMMPVK